MTTGTAADVDALRVEIKQLRADFTDLTETLRDVVRHGSEEATAKARETGERAWEEAKKRANSISHEIEEKPVTAALTAFSIGVILGLLFSGRR